MKARIIHAIIGIFLLAGSQLSYAMVVDQSPKSWPLLLEGKSVEMSLYQPMFVEKNADRLTFEMAFSVKAKGRDESTYGSTTGRCQLQTTQNQDLRCTQFQFDHVNFPLDTANEDEFRVILADGFVDITMMMDEEQLKRTLRLAEINKDRLSSVDLENKPPKIYVANQPTALITIDGEPKLRPLPNSYLMRVINTGYVIVFDPKTNQYYLRGGKQWHLASDLNQRTWEITTRIPNDLKKLTRQFKDETDEGANITQFIIATEPASLIVIGGEPQYVPIHGTDLLAVNNSSSMIFMQVKTQKIFTLISGRWYQTDHLSADSKWSYLPANKLPNSFANIPPDSEYGAVLASVPATPQASEAKIRNSVPTIAAVEKSKAKIKVAYDGKPRFKKIHKTPLQYAINSNNPVIYYQDQYYANHNAVWFVSGSPFGPWIVTANVPHAIYTIPPSNPLYRLTFNYVYGSYDGLIYFGYTPGYMGSYITPYGTVVFGTGYHYNPWIGNYYYGVPYTWGSHYYYHPYYGWYSNAPYQWFGISLSLGWVSTNIWYNNWYPTYWHKHTHKHFWHKKKNIYQHWNKQIVKPVALKPPLKINDQVLKKPFKRVYVAPKKLIPQLKPLNPQTKGPWIRPLEPKPTKPGLKPLKPQHKGPWIRPLEPKPTKPGLRPLKPQDKGPWIRPLEPKPTKPGLRPLKPQNKGPWITPKPKPTKPGLRPLKPQNKGPWIRPLEPKPTKPGLRPLKPQNKGSWITPKPKPIKPGLRPLKPQSQGPWIRPQPKPTKPAVRPLTQQNKGPWITPRPKPVNPGIRTIKPQNRGPYIRQSMPRAQPQVVKPSPMMQKTYRPPTPQMRTFQPRSKPTPMKPINP